MKVCLLGNMNLIGYVVAKLLRKRGVDAHLILYDSEYRFFLPESEDSALMDNYPEWIKKVNWGSNIKSFYMTKARDIQADLEGFDLYIACGYGPAFLRRAGIRNFIFSPYGGDLYEFPFWSRTPRALHKPYLRILLFLPNIILSAMQKSAIEECTAVRISGPAEPYEPYEQIIQRLHLENKVVHLGVPLDLEKFSPASVEKELLNSKDENLKKLISRQKEFDLTILSATRHVWTRQSLALGTANSKGNNILIEGAAQAIKKETISPLLILIEKGPDVLASKELIKQFGIEENVLWIPEMAREKPLPLWAWQ